MFTCSQTRIEKSGPTNFAPTIRKCLEIALANPCTETRPSYNILLIITDGIITDIRDTIDALVELAHQPFSIIIVGVGENDFGAMAELDNVNSKFVFSSFFLFVVELIVLFDCCAASLEPMVSSGGETVCRDIVQFVPFNRCDQWFVIPEVGKTFCFFKVCGPWY